MLMNADPELTPIRYLLEPTFSQLLVEMKTRACRPPFDSRKLDAENGHDGNCKLLGMAEHRNARVRPVVRPLAKQGGFEGGVNKNGSLKSLATRVGEVNKENSLEVWRSGVQREFSDTDDRQKLPL
jgi:hypothetical protein